MPWGCGAIDNETTDNETGIVRRPVGSTRAGCPMGCYSANVTPSTALRGSPTK